MEPAGSSKDVGPSTSGVVPAPPEQKKREQSPLVYVGLGLNFAISLGLFTLLGYWLDLKLGTQPWFLLGLSTLGIAVGLYHFVKKALR